MKKLYSYCVLQILLLAMLVLVGCSNPCFSLFEETQVVRFSPLVSTQVLAPTYLLYIDKNLAKQQIPFSDSLKSANSLELTLRKNQLTPILVYSGDADGQPYGCIYPLSTTISEKGGFCAWILYKLIISSRESPMHIYNFLSRFNWRYFESQIQKRENPWLLDQDLIFENIVDGTFNAYSLKNN